MLYGGILALHLLATAATALTIAFSLYAVVRGRDTFYTTCAVLLGLVAAFEVLTGTVLAVLSAAMTASELGMHIALYLGVCVAVELVLFIRMKQVPRLLPAEVALSPMLASLCFIAVAAAGY